MIVPCIDLMDGKVVQLVQGRDKALEGDAPLEMLRKFAAFPEIQVIDLDAAMGKGENSSLVELLASRARCRVGGGVRTPDRARKLVEQGAYRVIVGTAAFTPVLKEIAAAVGPERLIVALDSKHGKIVVKGWQEATDFTAEEVIGRLEPFCSGFLCTYVDKEGMMQGTDLDWFGRLRAATKASSVGWIERRDIGAIQDAANELAAENGLAKEHGRRHQAGKHDRDVRGEDSEQKRDPSTDNRGWQHGDQEADDARDHQQHALAHHVDAAARWSDRDPRRKRDGQCVLNQQLHHDQSRRYGQRRDEKRPLLRHPSIGRSHHREDRRRHQREPDDGDEHDGGGKHFAADERGAAHRPRPQYREIRQVLAKVAARQLRPQHDGEAGDHQRHNREEVRP